MPTRGPSPSGQRAPPAYLGRPQGPDDVHQPPLVLRGHAVDAAWGHHQREPLGQRGRCLQRTALCMPERGDFSCRTPAALGKENPGRPLSRPLRTLRSTTMPGRTVAASALHPAPFFSGFSSPPLRPCASLGLIAQPNVTQASPTTSCVHWPQGVVQEGRRTLGDCPATFRFRSKDTSSSLWGC